MNSIELNKIDFACFEVNEHGRLLSANRRFCKLFGFAESEIAWHYVTDLCRHQKDWVEFRDSTDRDSFEMRMRNRKGRSFVCRIIRQAIQRPSGEIIFRNILQRKGEASVENVLPATQTVVFLAKCAHCGQNIRVNTLGETHYRTLCPACTAQEYPESYVANALGL
ncbi:MAG: PAS domain-containing protein [Fibrobacter sp.]|nr:PAS domain-containing protein [Fibrobacter sp.]